MLCKCLHEKDREGYHINIKEHCNYPLDLRITPTRRGLYQISIIELMSKLLEN